MRHHPGEGKETVHAIYHKQNAGLSPREEGVSVSKVIAIMDRPKNCQECVFGVCKYSCPSWSGNRANKKGWYCQLKVPEKRAVQEFDYDADVKITDCPLKEIPQRAYHRDWCDAGRFDKGFNACLDKIIGTGVIEQ